MTSDTSPTEAFVWIWLPGQTTPVVCGRIRLRDGRHVFTYARSYLARDEAIPIYEPELPLRSDDIEPLAPLSLANSLRDAAPDAWGRRVIVHRQAGPSAAMATQFDDLGELTFMLESGSDRIGALDFQASPSNYLSREGESLALERLMNAAEHVERGVPLPPDLAQALLHGTSIGGARPKALLQDGGRKYVAKFSSSSDRFNVVKAEYVAMRLADIAGLNVAPVRLVRSLDKDVLLVERFDREAVEGGWRRRALVSALTLLGLDEMMAAYASYENLAETVRVRFDSPRLTLRELFSRMTFNILSGNTDDHARNHAAFWDGGRLSLTPAYDICPQSRLGREASQAMRLHGGARRSQLSLCLDSAYGFHLSKEAALDIMRGQIAAIAGHWTSVCEEAALSDADRRILWRGQFLNDLAFEGLRGPLGEALEALSAVGT